MTTATATDRHLAGPRVLRPADLLALLAAPDARRWRGRRDRALLACMALAGLRVGEAVRLARDNVEQARGQVRLTFTGAKSGVARTVTLPPTAATALRSWLADPRCGRWWLFAGRRGEHLSTRAARDLLDGYAAQAGLPGWLHPHSLRHGFGSMLMRQTSDLFRVQQALGHRSPKTTADYYLAYATRDADASAAALEQAIHPEGGAARVRKARVA
jgi:integrase